MKDQVTTIEQSRRLLRLGVPASKANMVWTYCNGDYHLVVPPHYSTALACIEDGVSVPAFTVVDLFNLFKPLGLLSWLSPCIERLVEWEFECGPFPEGEPYSYVYSARLVELLVNRITQRLSNGDSLPL